MSDYKQRMIREHRELQERIGKLEWLDKQMEVDDELA